MRGRKKNRAEKYDPEMDLDELNDRVTAGRFSDEPLMEYVLQHWGLKLCDWDLIEVHPHATPQGILLEECRRMLRKKDVAGFERLGAMMKAARELEQGGQRQADPQRAALLEVNESLYAAEMKKQKYLSEIKKSDLLRAARKAHPRVLDDLEDADVFRMMRSMGIPRRPYCCTLECQKKNDQFLKQLSKGLKKAGK